MNCNEPEVTGLLTDFALGILPAAQARRVEAHMADCEPCRAAMIRERALAQAVQATVHLATRPAPERLRSLMRPVPVQRKFQPLLWRPVAALALLALLFLGSLQVSHPGPAYGLPAASTTMLVATATQVPTAGSTQTPQISRVHTSLAATQAPVIRPPAAPRPARLP